jgi:O-antigen/teichoic acid export membrane protein
VGSLPISIKLAGDLLGRALLLAVFLVAARVLDGAQFGTYAYALAVGAGLAAIADGGLQLTLLRDLASRIDGVGGSESLTTAVVARTIISLPAAAIGVALAVSLPGAAPDRAGAAVIVVAQIATAYADLFAQVLRSAGRLQVEAAVMVTARAALAIAGLAVLVAGGGLLGLGVVYAVVGVAAPLAMGLAARTIVRAGRSVSLDRVRRAFRAALPIGLSMAASLLMFRIDVPILEWFTGPVTVGIYSAGYRVFEASLIVPAAVMAGAFPELARLASTDAFARSLRRWGTVLTALGLAAAVIAWSLGPTVIDVAFGSNYAAAGPLLQVLALAIPAMFLNSLLSQALVALHRSWRSTVAFTIALIVNVAVNVVLIPAIGAAGAAWATVAAETSLLLALAVLLATAARPVSEPGIETSSP